MSFRVRLEPSGREFSIEAQESVLDAALRAGLNLRYNCQSGSCGECRATLRAGAVSAALHSDYVLSEAEKGRGEFLMCSVHAQSDLVIEVAEVRSPDQLPLQVITARVTKLECIGEYGVLHLCTPRTHTLNFLAGQGVDVTIGGYTQRLAIGSCPCNGMQLAFHLRRGDEPFARAAFQLRSGDTVALRGPFGRFLLADERRPLVMVAQETGFAPIKSLIEHALALEWSHPIRVFWCAPAGGHYLDNYCRALEDALDDFRYVPLGDESEDEVIERVRRDIGDGDLYLAVSPVLAARLAAVAGPGARIFRYEA